jgi:hypothetical protein
VCSFNYPTSTTQINVFLFLTELASQTAEAVRTTLLDILHTREIEDYFLSECLVSVTCDGAAMKLSREGGVPELLLNPFPNIVWYCLNHRLHLSVDDTLREVAGINYVKVMMVEIRTFYYSFPKNLRRNACANGLDRDPENPTHTRHLLGSF